jgi:hypothetical protein
MELGACRVGASKNGVVVRPAFVLRGLSSALLITYKETLPLGIVHFSAFEHIETHPIGQSLVIARRRTVGRFAPPVRTTGSSRFASSESCRRVKVLVFNAG